jgi:predicted phosphoribosyltransferase
MFPGYSLCFRERTNAAGRQQSPSPLVVVNGKMPEPSVAVGQRYEVFEQTSDDEARELFERAD